MQDMDKRMVGLVTVLLYFAGALSAYSQYSPAQFMPGYQEISSTASEVDQLDEISAEIASLKSQLAEKADKPNTRMGWSSPKIGGRIFMDYVSAMNQDWDGLDTAMETNVDTQNWFGFREARLSVSGTGYDFLDYKFELGFEPKAESCPSFKDLALGIQHVPILEYLRIGHQYVEDVGSEVWHSTMGTFMDGPGPVGQQFMVRRLGVTSRHLFAENRVRLFFGAYNATNLSDIHYRKADYQGIVLNTRMTVAPVFDEDGRRLLLFGAYYLFVDSSSEYNCKRNLAFSRPSGWDVYNPTGLEFFLQQSISKGRL